MGRYIFILFKEIIKVRERLNGFAPTSPVAGCHTQSSKLILSESLYHGKRIQVGHYVLLYKSID